MPIVIEVGTTTTNVINTIGDSSKLISIYGQKDVTNPINSSTIEAQLNVNNFTLSGILGVESSGIVTSWSKDNQIKSHGIILNLAEAKIGYEYSSTIQWDNSSQTSYTNASISGWWVIGVYSLLIGGQNLSPNLAIN